MSRNDTIKVDIGCREVNHINSSNKCLFVQETPSCHSEQGYLDYINFIFCVFQSNGTYGAVVVIVLWLIVLFIALGVTADDFLCPALVVISKTLRLSQNIAGVTFLAFGNGAPDIFSSLAGIQQARSDLVIGELFGAGIFVTTVVAGTICLGKPFKIMERPFLRDVIFYIWATFWAFCLFYAHQIKLRSAAGFVALYGIYIIVVILSRVIYQRSKSCEPSSEPTTPVRTDPEQPGNTNEIQSASTPVRIPSPPLAIILTPPDPCETTPASPGAQISKSLDERRLSIFKRTKNIDDPEAEGVVLRRFSYRSNLAIPRKRTLSQRRSDGSSTSSPSMQRRRSISDPVYVIPSLPPPTPTPTPTTTNPSERPKRPSLHQRLSTTSLASLVSAGGEDLDLVQPWKDFLFELCPIDSKSWKDRSWYSKALDVIKAPVFFLLALTTPVVDFEAERQNWCKYLNVLHVITGPMFVCICASQFTFQVGGVMPIWSIVLLVSSVLAIVVFFTSIVDEPPRYHALFSYLGFGVSVTWIYGLAHEIVALLQAIGIVFNLSDTILGLTVLAWGNSIGDFISNTSVARQGFPRMGISACYGGPLLNLLLGIGIPYTLSLVQSGSPLELEYTKLVLVLYAALTISLVSTLVTMTALRFQVKKQFGGYLLLVYACFLVVAILVESKII